MTTRARPAALVRWGVAVAVVAGMSAAGIAAVDSTERSSQLDRLLASTPGTTWTYRTSRNGRSTGLHVVQAVGTIRGAERPAIAVRSVYTGGSRGGPGERTSYLAAVGGSIVKVGHRDASGYRATSPPQPQVREPLKPGTSWRWSGSDGGVEHVTMSGRIVAAGPLRVLGEERAGCLHVVQHLTYALPEGGVHDRYDEWRCPGLGVVRSREQLPQRGLDLRERLVGIRRPGGSLGPGAPSSSTGGRPAATAAGWVRGARFVGGVAWTQTRTADVTLPPVGDDRIEILAEPDGTVSAYEPATGRVRWRIQVAGPVVAAPLLAGALVLVADAERDLLALDVEQGWARWIAHLPDVVAAAPAASGGRVFVIGEDRELRALALADGRRLWKFRLGTRAHAPPAVVGRDVVVADESGALTAVDERTGDTAWTATLDGSMVGGLVAAGRTVAAVDDADNVSAFDARTGRLRWQHALGDSAAAAPALADDSVVVATVGGRVLALDAATGRTRWRARAPAVRVPPIVLGDTVVLLSRHAELSLFALGNGAPRGVVKLAPPIPGSLVDTDVPLAWLDGALVVKLTLEQPWLAPTELVALRAPFARAVPPPAPAIAGNVLRLPAPLSYPISPPVAVDGGVVAAVRIGGGKDGTWYLPRHGTPLRLSSSDSFVPFAVPSGDVVYTQAGDRLVVVPLSGGPPRWSVRIGGPAIGNGPVRVGPVLVVPTPGAGLVGLDAASGRRRWATPLDNPLALSRPAALGDGDVVYAAGDALRLDAATGRIRWRVRGLTATGPIAVGDGHVYVHGVVGSGPGQRSVLAAVDAGRGTAAWTRPTAAAIGLGVAASEGVVVAADATGAVRAYAGVSGALLWERVLRTPAAATPAIVGDVVVCVQTGRTENAFDRDRELVLFDLPTGRYEGSVEVPRSSLGFAGAVGASGGGVFVAGLRGGAVLLELRLR